MSYSNLYGGNPFLYPAVVPGPVKRRVFISSYHANRVEVDAFIAQWATLQGVFTPKAICTFDNDDFINSDNPEYVMSEIRRKYLGDASVSTHSRRYVDWEINTRTDNRRLLELAAM